MVSLGNVSRAVSSFYCVPRIFLSFCFWFDCRLVSYVPRLIFFFFYFSPFSLVCFFPRSFRFCSLNYTLFALLFRKHGDPVCILFVKRRRSVLFHPWIQLDTVKIRPETAIKHSPVDLSSLEI